MIAALFRSLPLRLALSLALTGAIAFLSLIPGDPEADDPALVVALGTVPSLFQNAMHLVLYAVLTLFWAAALAHFGRLRRWGAIGVFLYGVMLEIAQFFVAGRYASWLDLGLNGAGVLLGAALAARLIPPSRRA